MSAEEKSPSEFHLPLTYVEASKHRDVPRERALRLYCTQYGALWSLQIRTPVRLDNGRDGQDFIISTASLDRDSLAALRDACDRMLKDHDREEESCARHDE